MFLALTCTACCLPAAAAEKYGNSLDWVPADVAFYSASLRLKEQVQIVAESNAWRKFRAIPSIERAWNMVEAQINDPNGPAALGLQMMQLPENQQLLQMIGDMFSSELVVYGGPKCADVAELYARLNGARQIGQIQSALGDSGQARLMLETLNESQELLHIPDLTFAFKLVDQAAAQTQLKRLEIILQMALRQTPIADRFKREKVGNAEYLTLSLDGSLVPWDQIPWEQAEIEPGEFDGLREKLEGMTLVISLGVRDNYLLFSIDESTDGLARLGTASALASIDEFAPLAKFRDRKLASIGYMSKDLATRMGYNAEDIDGVVEQVGSILDLVGVEDGELKDRIALDIEKLGDDVKAYIPKPGAVMGFSFLTDTGFEGYTYNWTEDKTLDSTQPLSLTSHIGGNPLLAVVGRAKYDPESYDLMVKWLKVGYTYFEDFALPQMGGDEREKTTKVLEVLKPLLARADKNTREALIPALKDGQNGFVLEAGISSRQWQRDMPMSAQPLPMAELGLVVGVSDINLFKKAIVEYQAIADEVVSGLRKVNPDDIPADFQLPRPQMTDTGSGTLYVYSLPAEAGLDSQIAPTAGIGKDVAVLTSSPRLATALLADKPVESSSFVGTASKQPCGSVIVFSWPALVDAITPWVEFAITQNHPESRGQATVPPSVASIIDQVKTGMEILKCWKSTQAVVTQENGALVTHSVTVFQDTN